MSSCSYMVSKNPPTVAHGGDRDSVGSDDAAAVPPPVTSCLYLHRPGPLDRDAVLRRIHHRRRHNRLRDSLLSMLQAPPPETVDTDVERQQLAWQLEDAFSAP